MIGLVGLLAIVEIALFLLGCRILMKGTVRYAGWQSLSPTYTLNGKDSRIFGIVSLIPFLFAVANVVLSGTVYVLAPEYLDSLRTTFCVMRIIWLSAVLGALCSFWRIRKRKTKLFQEDLFSSDSILAAIKMNGR